MIRELTDKAIDKLDAMRQREGESLFNELMKHVKVIADEPRPRSPSAPRSSSRTITSG